jgi:hypothetical protein
VSNQKPILPTPKPSVRKKIAHEEKAKTQLKEKQTKLRANIRNARKLAAKSTAELDTILAQRGVVDNKIGVVTDDIISKLPIELRDTVKEEDIIFRPNPGPQTQFLAATAPIDHAALCKSHRQGLSIHPGHHQDLTCLRALGDCRNKTVTIEGDGV